MVGRLQLTVCMYIHPCILDLDLVSELGGEKLKLILQISYNK